MLRCLILLLMIAQPALDEIGGALTQAERSYDVSGVESALNSLALVPVAERALEWHALEARGRLLAADLRRIEFEQLPESAAKERRDLGKAIDAHAEAGLAAVALLPESSETHRYKADLIGTMIRSNYRAGKLKGDMKSAIDAALRQEPRNAKAMVSHAKMLVFNPQASHADLTQGVALLEQALAIDGELEAAELLRAHALEQLGDHAAAMAIWAQCLQANPACKPARDALEKSAPRPDGA